MKPFRYIVFGILIAVALTSGLQSFAIVDNYQQAPPTVTAPYNDMFLVSTVDSDTEGAGGYMTEESRGLLVTTAGDFKLVTHKGNTRTLTLAVGYHPLRAKQFYITGTTGVAYVGL